MCRRLPTRSRLGRLFAWAAAIAATVLLGACQTISQRESRALPPTIPALQEWRSAPEGEFRLGMQARIVRAPADAAALEETSQLFADDLGALFGRDFPQVVASEADMRPGDIYLALASGVSEGPPEGGGGTSPATAAEGPEGYSLRIGEHLALGAANDVGVFHGTQTLLQLLRQSERLPYGVARDWPQKGERGLMVDAGRKYFSPGWLRDEICELAYLKLNTLHLHLTDNEGFRIESVTHPEIVSPEHLTKVRELIAFAAQRHITVVPEIDMPSHMAVILAAHPELQLYDPQHTAPTGEVPTTAASI